MARMEIVWQATFTEEVGKALTSHVLGLAERALPQLALCSRGLQI